MAIYNLRVSPANGRSSLNKFNYIMRINDFSYSKDDKYDDFIYGENKNMPTFSISNPSNFWDSAEAYERKNGNTFREIEFSLPHEISLEENIELVNKFADKLFGSNFVYSYAIHSKPSEKENINNIHCHILFSERELDGIERTEENFFKRYNNVNPEKGGCKKNSDWKKFKKLYEIRETWEEIANEKLSEYNLEISCKSLKNQRIDAILEGNFLKAEFFDREPINYNKFIKFTTNEELKAEYLNFYNYSKKIKELKAQEFKLRSENFEIENEKAKQRFLHPELEDHENNTIETEGKQSPSFCDLEKNFNFKNIFITSLDNEILLERKEKRFKKINSISNIDIKNRALNILTKNEYSNNLNRLEELNSLYNNLSNKTLFKFHDEKEKLENYFKSLESNEYFNTKLIATIDKIKIKYDKENTKLLNDMKFLRKNDFKDFYLKNSPRNYEMSKLLISETYSYIKDLKAEKENIDNQVENYKKLLNKDYKLEVYKSFGKETLLEKYNTLLTLREESKNNSDDDLKKKLNLFENSFKAFDIENNINDKVNDHIKEIRSEYKALRKEQDDIHGKLFNSRLMLNKLSKIEEIKVINNIELFKESYNNLQKKNNSELEKLEYNISIEKLQNSYKKIFKSNIELNIFDIDKKEIALKYRKEIKSNILLLQKENINLQKILSKNIVNDENIKNNLYDKVSNGEYSNYKKLIIHCDEQINNNKNISHYSSMKEEALRNIAIIEKNNNISNQDIILEKQMIQSKNLDLLTKLRNNKDKLEIYFKMLKNTRTNKIFKPRLNTSNSKKLKVLESGKIIIDDQEKNKKWQKEYEYTM